MHLCSVKLSTNHFMVISMVSEANNSCCSDAVIKHQESMPFLSFQNASNKSLREAKCE